MPNSPREGTKHRHYREDDQLYAEVQQACAYYGTNVSADIVAHHLKLVKRWKRDLASAGQVENANDGL